MSDENKNQIYLLIQQLYENEGLTDALTDEAATLLLRWGEQQLNKLAYLHLSQIDLENVAHDLGQTIRAVNRLVERRTDLSDVEMVEHLLELMDQVIIITSTVQQTIPQGDDNGQKTAEQFQKTE